MLLKPAILALLLVSLTGSGMVLLAAGFAFQVVRHWDIGSGSELQLRLERRTYLISTLLVFCFAAELVSLLLFVMNAESMSGQFVGAMCATGVLNVNGYGWPVLFVKIIIFFSGVSWLLLNQVDNRANDYPLTRVKYSLLLALVPLLFLETSLLFLYVLGLNPDVITSCCGSLFSADARGVAAEVSGLQPRTGLIALAASGVGVFISGLWYELRGRGGLIYGGLSVVAFVVALAAMVSVISLYVYEHPHHHCPFCILKSGHDFIGYLLYLPLFAATAAGLGVVVVLPWGKIGSLQDIVPNMAGRLVRCSLGMFIAFYILVAIVIVSSGLTMTGVWWR